MAGRWFVLLVLAGGVGLSYLLYRTLDTWERQALQTELDGRAGARARLLDSSLRQSMDVLYGLSSLIEASGTTAPADSSLSAVSRSQFRVFVAQALKRQPELQAIGWTPLVRRADRAAFEQAARADGLTDFEFRELSSDGRTVRSVDRDEYLPVFYLEPEHDNVRALGFELDSDPVRLAALRSAEQSGQPTATPPVALVQKPSQGVGFMVYLAVRGSSGPRQEGERPAGFASAVFRIEHLIASVEGRLAEDGLAMSVADESSGGGVVLYDGNAGSDSRTEYQGRSTVSVAGRTWSLKVHPTPAFVARTRHRESLPVLGGGIVVSLLLAAYLSAGMRRRITIEQRVDQRTTQLRQAEAKARSIVENAVEGMFQTSVEGRYLSANPALARIYGYASVAELMASVGDVGERLYVDPRRRAEFVACVQRDGVVMEFESQVRRKDGRVIWISENARVVRDDKGELLYFEGSVVDITDRKRAERLLRQDREALEVRVKQRTTELDQAVSALQREVAERTKAQAAAAAASQAKSRFLANITHEIRTPMNAILGYAQLLGGDANLTAGQRDAMATILSSGRHLLDLIEDVLDLSKIEAGRAEVSPTAFALLDTAREVAALFAGRCTEKGLLLRVDAPGGDDWPAHVWGDSRKIRQVLINLLGNAVKFTDTGGVTLSITRSSADRYRFDVVDTGIGIPDDTIDAIFEPFLQAPSGVRRGGTGLGLSIAKGLIEAMGGHLRVQSMPGHGTRFDFELTLPATAVENTLVSSRVGRVTLPDGVVRALVVDDVDESRRVVAEMLRRVGCETSEAASAAEAVSAASVFRPALALIDVMMPEVDGVEVASILARQHGSNLKLIAMSASPEPETRQRCLDGAFHAFVAKPIDLARLTRLIARLLGTTATDNGPTGIDPSGVTIMANEMLPELRRRIVRAARRCSVTDLKQCLNEIEQTGGDLPAVTALRRGLRNYDMDLILRAFDANDSEDA